MTIKAQAIGIVPATLASVEEGAADVGSVFVTICTDTYFDDTWLDVTYKKFLSLYRETLSEESFERLTR